MASSHGLFFQPMIVYDDIAQAVEYADKKLINSLIDDASDEIELEKLSGAICHSRTIQAHLKIMAINKILSEIIKRTAEQVQEGYSPGGLRHVVNILFTATKNAVYDESTFQYCQHFIASPYNATSQQKRRLSEFQSAMHPESKQPEDRFSAARKKRNI